MRIEVARETADGLGRQLWVFWVNETDIVLDQYQRQNRPSKRHKFPAAKRETSYSRLYERQSGMAEADVPLPEDVAEEARQRLIERVRVIKWSGRHAPRPGRPRDGS